MKPIFISLLILTKIKKLVPNIKNQSNTTAKVFCNFKKYYSIKSNNGIHYFKIIITKFAISLKEFYNLCIVRKGFHKIVVTKLKSND